jgi:hypothetical protein
LQFGSEVRSPNRGSGPNFGNPSSVGNHQSLWIYDYDYDYYQIFWSYMQLQYILQLRMAPEYLMVEVSATVAEKLKLWGEKGKPCLYLLLKEVPSNYK